MVIRSELRRWWLDFVNLFFPEVCVVCGRPLVAGEKTMCLVCDVNMPRTDFHRDPDNQIGRASCRERV